MKVYSSTLSGSIVPADPDDTAGILPMKVSFKTAIAERLPVEARLLVDTEDAYDPAPAMVILAASRSWIFGWDLDERDCPDGFVALRRNHVRDLQSSPAMLFRKRALLAERLWPEEISVAVPDLSDAGSILDDLRRNGRLAIVLVETREGWRSLHCRVEKVGPTTATLQGFHGNGEWMRRVTPADLSVITQIRFDSRYLRLYESQLRP